MVKQILFITSVLIAFGIFTFSIRKIFALIKLTKPYPVKDIGKRISLMLEVAIGQTKIFRKPFAGFFHALVFWGFCVILFGSLEMMIDGITGLEKSLSFLGIVYEILMAFGDIFALLVLISIIVFLARRLFFHIKRFSGIEMEHKSHADANIALTLILLLMVSLLGMNISYISITGEGNYYPVSNFIFGLLGINGEYKTMYEVCWWTHILMIFIFMNVLPYSKHFHVFMSVPNVFLSRLEPLGKLPNMDNVTREVKIMMDPNLAYAAPSATDAPPERFGAKDPEDVTWKTYLDSLSCTECGRCTSVCPANITGKKLSPRKLMMNLRARMKEKGPQLIKNKSFDDGKSLRDYISPEEIWACTTCNACAKECPINMNHPILIMELRRYIVMEESAAPSGLNTIFNNIQNNGAPWQFSPEDRLIWANDITVKQK
ncbi:MAG TPA: 4Fe-4S dicluster domain-containing protein [Bacteroidales bacterium]|nr:4Fe-4S dicluster domain-containing protein [Bacteroidales bacterium]HPS16648.1 4Fe-4S dicluster domain-containing protein [Bacteroidales bacterium]